MKVKAITVVVLIAVVSVLAAACSSTKKSAAPVATTPTTMPPDPLPVVARAENGIYEPGEAELAAIRVEYKDVTLEKLKQGHYLYTAGACINCHNAKNIYKRGEEQWKYIMDDMALRSKLTDEQKDAVFKYVLAIKRAE